MFPVSDLLRLVVYNQTQLEYVTNKMTCLALPCWGGKATWRINQVKLINFGRYVLALAWEKRIVLKKKNN